MRRKYQENIKKDQTRDTPKILKEETLKEIKNE